MYDMVISTYSNRKIMVTSVLMKHMLCRRERSLVGNRRLSVLIKISRKILQEVVYLWPTATGMATELERGLKRVKKSHLHPQD